MNSRLLDSRLYLGWHFFLRMLRRIFFIRSPGLREFLQNYRNDRLPAITAKEKAVLRGAHRCVSCGLCDSRCPAIARAIPAGFLGPSFLPHLSRSVPDFAGIVDLEACSGCPSCESICPESVPIKKILGYMKEKDAQVA